MPLDREYSALSNRLDLEDIRKFYFDNTKRTLRIEDAKYLLERAEELNITKNNGGVKALFDTLKYKFGQEDKEGILNS